VTSLLQAHVTRLLNFPNAPDSQVGARALCGTALDSICGNLLQAKCGPLCSLEAAAAIDDFAMAPCPGWRGMACPVGR